MSIARAKHLQIENRLIESLKPFPHNARTHTKKQINQIGASIREFGFTNPVLIDTSGTIIAGHGRVAAAKTLGFDKVPTIQIDYLNEAQKRAYVIADNKLALNAGWDPEILAIELQHLSSIDVDFDVEITGFETAC
jgi:ParB-like chromosome segregation protein Spo0J